MASKGGVIVVVSGEDKTGEVFNAIKKHMEDTKETAKETSESLGQMGETLKRGLEAAGIAVGLREIIGGFKEMVSTAMETGVTLGHLSKQTGISVENLSVLKYAASATGIEFETLTKAFKKLSTETYEAENGSKTAQKAFGDLGISQADLKAKGNDLYGVMSLIADKFKDMPDGIQKNALATELFGRAGQQLIPILDEGSGGIDKFKSEAEALGLVLDDAGVKKMEEMHRAVAGMSGAFAGLGLEITSSLAPALAQAAKDMTGFIELMRLSSSQTLKGMYGAVLQDIFGSAGPGLDIQLDAAKQLVALQKQAQQSGGGATPGTPPGAPPPQNVAKQQSAAAELAAAQERLDATLRTLADAGAKLDETRARVHSQTMLSILDDMHKQGLVSEADYLTQKANLQNASYDAERTKLLSERRALTDQMNTLASGETKTGKDRLEMESKLNALQAKNLDITGQLVVLDAKRATSARQIEEAYAALIAKPIDMSGLDQGLPPNLFPAAKMPNVTLAKDYSSINNEAEKFAHGLFDPLFDLGEKWNQQWKQIRANMLRDLGQAAESQLFGALFGDPSGRGGKGWDGSGSHGPGTGHGGLVSEGIGAAGSLLSGLFGKKSSPVSNGTGTAGAGTVLSSVAGALQVGKGAGSGTGGVQVILNNMGTPATVDSTQQSGGSAEAMILQVVLKDQQTNGAITQGFSSLFNH